MSDWYKMNPLDWNEGTDELSLEQEAAYLRICHGMYVTGKAIPDNKFIVAGLLRCNDRRAERLLNELVAAGKLTREGGCISNRRAMEEISNRDRLSVGRASAGSRGGIESGKSRSKALKNNNSSEANASAPNEADKIREEEIDTPLPPRGNGQVDQAIKIYSDAAVKAGLTIPKTVTADRRKRIEARLKEHGLESWREACERMAASSFCRGGNDRGWRADLDFVTQPKSFNGLIEGKYDTIGKPFSGSSRQRQHIDGRI